MKIKSYEWIKSFITWICLQNDIDDMRESPALKVIEHLEKMELTYRLMIHIYLNLNIKVNCINHQI